MENFEEKQSKYGKIYKVAGPRKSLFQFYLFLASRFMRGSEQIQKNWFTVTHFIFYISCCGRKHVWIKNVRARQNWMGQVGR